MAIGREVADAYIEVHGDLSKFRKDLMKARGQAREAGEKFGQEFADGFEKRAREDMGRDKDSIIDALYSGDTVDWDRAFGRFDSKNLDSAQDKMLDFMNDMKESGTMSANQFETVSEKVKDAARAVDDANEAERKHNLLISDGAKLRAAAALSNAKHLENIKRLTKEAREETIRFNNSWEGMDLSAQDKAFKKSFERLADFMNGVDVGPNMKSQQSLDDFKEKMIATAEAAKNMGRMTGGEFDHIRHSISKLKPELDGVNSKISDGAKRTGIMGKLSEKLKTSWARMDGTVKGVLTLIASAAGPMAAGLSGVAASGTAVVSSLALAAAAAVPLGAAMLGIGVAVGLAATAMENMKKKFPGIEKAANKVGDAWGKQADRFGMQWGAALTTFLSTFASKLAKYDFGTPMGKAVSNITDAFTGVLNSPGFDALMKALSTDLPKAVEGFGKGLAGMVGGLSSLLAGAAPVAAQLGADFEGWGAKFSKSMETMRKSGKLQEVFEKARESLLAVLDLTGSLGSALGSVFMLGADSGNRLLKSLTAIVDQWKAFMGTVEGKNAMEEWFRNGERIIKSFKPLLIGLAQALDTLVTPHAISQFEDLMASIGALLPIIAEMLNVVSNLGILNILADLFLLVGEAVRPLLGPLAEITKSLGGYLRDAIAALTPLFMAIGQALKPFIEGIGKIISIVGPVLAPAIAKISAALTPVIAVIGQVAGVIMSVLAPVLGTIIVGIIDNLVGVINGLATVFMGIVDVIQGVFGLIVGIFTGNGQMITDSFTQVFNGLWGIVSGAFEAVWNAVQLILIGKIFMGIKAFLTPLKGLFTATFNGIKTFVMAVWNGLGTFFTTILGGIRTAFTSSLKAVGSVVSTVFGAIKTFIKGALDEALVIVNFVLGGVRAAFTGALKFIDDLWKATWNAITKFVGPILTKAKTKITEIMTAIKTKIKSVMDATKAVWSTVWTAIRTTAEKIITAVRTKIASVMDAIKTKIKTVMDATKLVWSTIWTAIRTKVTDIINAVRSKIGTVMDSIKTKIKTVMDLTKTVWSNIWTSIRTKVTDIVNAIRSKVGSVMDSVKSKIKSVMDSIKSTWSSIWTSIRTKASDIITAIRTKVSSVMDSIKSKVSSAMNSIKGTFSRIWSSIKTVVANAINAVKSKVSDVLSSIKGTVSSKMASIKTAFSNAWNAVKTTITSAMGKIKTAVSTGITSVVSTVRGLPGKARSALSSIGSTLVSAGTNLMKGFINGIKSMAGRIAESALAPVRNAVSKVKNFLGINSPSRLFRQFGGYTGEGLALGMDDQKKNVLSSAIDMAKVAVSQFNTSKMAIAGRDAAKGFAEGLGKGKNLVKGALGKLSTTEFPVAAIGTPTFGVGSSASTTTETASTGKVINIEAGAITLSTPATNGAIAAEQLLDGLTRKIGG